LGPVAFGATPPMGGSAPIYAADPMHGETEKWQERLATGFLLMIIGFFLEWIPYADLVGGLIGLIGIFFVYFGRHGFDEPYQRYVSGGVWIVFVSILASIGIAVWFVVALFGLIVVNATTGMVTLGPGFASLLETYIVALVAIGLLRAVGYTLIPWGFGDALTRRLLLVAFVAQIVVSLVSLWYFLPLAHQISSALQSSPTSNPTARIDTATDLLTLLNVAPALLYAWAYLRARKDAIGLRRAPGGLPPSGPVTSGPSA
jgi:hypothetical protein